MPRESDRFNCAICGSTLETWNTALRRPSRPNRQGRSSGLAGWRVEAAGIAMPDTIAVLARIQREIIDYRLLATRTADKAEAKKLLALADEMERAGRELDRIIA